ncbi:MAG: VIT family protein [Arthrobacter sp.]|jgi:VIT1/CCC1 family predicted Fe2+/Mn2+ transporter|nr:VIT family protein [Arthrobacter sp.]
MSTPEQQASPTRQAGPHEEEHGAEGLASKLNWLRAGVLGANDGIVSVAAVVVGVAGATPEVAPIVVAGAAAVVGGAISMALGEYVSVSSQRDAQRALVAKEREELASMPEEELEELTQLYEAKGLSRATAEAVAQELTERDALRAHLETELHIDEDDIPSPWAAAAASAVAFLVGAALPFLMAILLPPAVRIPATFVAVLVALGLTGAVGAYLGGAKGTRAAVRTIVGGALALAVTWGIGAWLGTGIA